MLSRCLEIIVKLQSSHLHAFNLNAIIAHAICIQIPQRYSRLPKLPETTGHAICANLSAFVPLLSPIAPRFQTLPGQLGRRLG